MTIVDACCDCQGPLDVTKRVYQGPNGSIRCGVCQIIAEMRVEIARITAIVALMEDVGEGRAKLH